MKPKRGSPGASPRGIDLQADQEQDTTHLPNHREGWRSIQHHQEREQRDAEYRSSAEAVEYLSGAARVAETERHWLHYLLAETLFVRGEIDEASDVYLRLVDEQELPPATRARACLKVAEASAVRGDVRTALRFYLLSVVRASSREALSAIALLARNLSPHDSGIRKDLYNCRTQEVLARRLVRRILGIEMSPAASESSEESLPNLPYLFRQFPARTVELPSPRTLNSINPAFVDITGRTAIIPPLNVHLVPRGIFVVKNGGVRTAGPDGEALPDASYYPERCVPLPETVHHVPGRAAVICDQFTFSNYAHWIYDYLPRVRQFRECFGNSIEYWIVHNLSLPAQRESLEAVGIPPDRCVVLEQHEGVMADELLVTSSMGDGVHHPLRCADGSSAAYLREQCGAFAARSRFPTLSRILVSRSDSSRRRLIGEDELMRELKPLGFVRICPSDYAFADQVKLFSSARIIVGAHGAGMTNLVFAPPGTSVLEVFCPLYGAVGHYGGALAAGHRYAYLNGFDPLCADDIAAGQLANCTSFLERDIAIGRGEIEAIVSYVRAEIDRIG